MIIGLTGKYASGKSEIANYLVKKHGFGYLSFSGIMEKAAQERGIPVLRESIIAFANEMREQHSAGYWSEQVIAAMKPGTHYVVESIRNPAEITAFRSRKDFVLVAVDAPQKTRFGRMLARGRNADENMRTISRFREMEKQESKNTNPNAQQIDACIAQADVVFDNTADLPVLFAQIEKLLKHMEVKA